MSTFGLDYAFQPHPSTAAIKKAGAKFVCRYLAGGAGGSKELTPAEAKVLSAAGINIICVWETTAGRATEGHAAGKHDVHAALAQAAQCGMPNDRPIFFAVDFDAAGPGVHQYFQAVKETIGWRAGVYGGIRVVEYLHDHGLVGWSWQTYAWSGGQWDKRAHLQQYSNGHNVGGADCDYDRGMFADYGQWRVGWSPAKPTPKPKPKPTPAPIPKPSPKLPYVFPVQGRFVEGRTDRGVDMETVPHCHIYAVGDCEITSVPPNSAVSSLGQIVMKLSKPYSYGGKRWTYAYVFHIPKSQIRVRAGQKLKAGAVIATSGTHPPGAEDMPGHIEYGFAVDRLGNIQPASDASHRTLSGVATHSLLRRLNPGHIGSKPIRG